VIKSYNPRVTLKVIMNFLNGLVSNIKDINTATLTGAVDVILVESPDGIFRSTPFHVRFGKIGVVWSHEKQLDVEINGQEVDLVMRLDQYGVGYFPDITSTDDGQLRKSFHDTGQSQRRKSRHKSQPCLVTSQQQETIQRLQADSELIAKHVAAAGQPHKETPGHLADVVEAVISRKNTLQLTREELTRYRLNPGCNDFSFSITSQYQGTTRCSCNVFVWKHDDRVVISDIDGTITKSDVRGMLLPLMGITDWAQGEVAPLFSKINANGYKILYLSARSISQAAETKSYLQSLRQGNLKLPDGPLFLNPESALKSFKREVIDKQPDIFKIHCLTVLQRLFPTNPYFAGYGNKPTDVSAYQKVGIPTSHIFIINKTGDLKHQVCESVITSYKDQCNMVDFLFPPVSISASRQNYLYWKEPVLPIESSSIL